MPLPTVADAPFGHAHGRDALVVTGPRLYCLLVNHVAELQPCSAPAVAAWPHPWPRPAAEGERITLAGRLCPPKDVLDSGMS